jgi:hypothetical protein
VRSELLGRFATERDINGAGGQKTAAAEREFFWLLFSQ